MSQNNYFLTDKPDSLNEFRSIIQAASEEIVAAMKDSHAYSGPSPDELKKIIHLDNLLPENGIGFQRILKEIKEKILPYLLRPSSTDYMAHLHSPVLLECIAAELILTTFNQSMDSWDQSPVATEIEVEVVRALCRMYGLGENSDGVFTSGGSQSNFSGLLLARDWYCNHALSYDVKKFGLPVNYRKLRLYTSEISHFSIEKTAHILGLGYESVVKVPVNDKQQMDFSALCSLVKKDVESGNLPFCVVGTVGTTDFGSIDPLPQLRELCDEYGMWLHADAAYGSGVILSGKYKGRVAGLDSCDSITVDFHKMFLMPISCSASLVKDKSSFDVLTIHADYLNRVEDEEDGYTNLVDKSMQTTRRFDALKVWVSFQSRGADGWQKIIDTCIENAAYLFEQLKNSADFEPAVKPQISSVVFRVKPVSGTETQDDLNKRIRRALLHEKGVVIGQTVYHGDVYLKFTLLNPLVTHEKLDEMLALIKSMR